MLPEASWIIDVLDCASDATEKMEVVQRGCLTRFFELFVSTIARLKQFPSAGVALDAYNQMNSTWRARVLMGAEVVHIISKIEDPHEVDQMASNVELLSDIFLREQAIHDFFIGTKNSYLLGTDRDRIWSSLGDHILERRDGKWHSVNPITIGGVIKLDFDSPIACQHELRSGVLSQIQLPFTESEKIEVANKLEDALLCIDASVPQYGILIRNFTRRIIIRKSVEIDTDIKSPLRSTSSEHVARQPGCIRILNPHLPEKTRASCMETILHESIHVFITALENARGAFTSTTRNVRPVSPWSGNLIPNSAFNHAIFIYYACHRLFVDALAREGMVESQYTNDLRTRLQHFAAGFMSDHPLSSQFVISHELDSGLIYSLNEAQNRIKQFYRKNLNMVAS